MLNGKAEGRRPLFVSFDVRPAHLAVVKPGLNDEDAGIFEQIGLNMKWILMRMGGDEWTIGIDEALEKHYTIAGPSPDLGTTQKIILQSSSTDLSPSYVHITLERTERPPISATRSTPYFHLPKV